MASKSIKDTDVVKDNKKKDDSKTVTKRGRKPVEKSINEDKENITMTQVKSRMSEIFTNYRNIGLNDYINAMSKAWETNNPYIQNQRIKKINSPIRSSTKQEIAAALESPDGNEALFRSESQALYWQNYVYNNILKLNREVPMYFNYVTPCNVTLEDCKKKEFKTEMNFVEDFVEKLNLRKVGKDIAINVALEGKRSYVVRTSYKKDKSKVNFAVLQKLPSEWVKYTGLGSSTDYITSFDFMMFLQPGENIDNYPPFFREIWDNLLDNKIIILNEKTGKYEFYPQNTGAIKDHMLEYSNDRYFYWVDLPQEEVYVFGSDNSSALAIPDYVGLFSDFRGLDDYKWLQNQLLSRSVNSVLVGTVPLIDNTTQAGADETAISMDSIIGFSDMFANAVSSNILPFFAPFEDYKLLSLPLPPDAKEINNTALKNLINSSGLGALLTTTDKPSIISVKTAQQLAEAKAEYVMLQVQSCINNYINRRLGLKYKFKVTIWGGRFTYLDELKYYKELLISGVPSVFPRILSAANQSVSDADAITNYMDSLGFYDSKFRPFSTLNKESVQGSDFDNGEEKKRGRKPVGDDLENDNTANSLDLGTNVSDIKDFSANICHKCGKSMIEDEQFICDSCLDELYQERINDLLDK